MTPTKEHTKHVDMMNIGEGPSAKKLRVPRRAIAGTVAASCHLKNPNVKTWRKGIIGLSPVRPITHESDAYANDDRADMKSHANANETDSTYGCVAGDCHLGKAAHQVACVTKAITEHSKSPHDQNYDEPTDQKDHAANTSPFPVLHSKRPLGRRVKTARFVRINHAIMITLDPNANTQNNRVTRRWHGVPPPLLGPPPRLLKVDEAFIAVLLQSDWLFSLFGGDDMATTDTIRPRRLNGYWALYRREDSGKWTYITRLTETAKTLKDAIAELRAKWTSLDSNCQAIRAEPVTAHTDQVERNSRILKCERQMDRILDRIEKLESIQQSNSTD